MNKETIRTLILRRFRQKYLAGNYCWVNGQEISDKMHLLTGHKHAIIDRELRRMSPDEGEKLLEKKMMTLKEGGTESIWYRFIPSHSEELSFKHRYNL